MKNIYFMVILCLPISSYSQDNGDNTIVIKTDNVAYENYVNLGKSVKELGYEVQKSDDLYHIVYLKPIKVIDHNRIGQEIWYYVIPVFDCDDNSITVTANFKKATKRQRRLEYDSNDNAKVLAFNKIIEISQKLGEAKYIKQ